MRPVIFLPDCGLISEMGRKIVLWIEFIGFFILLPFVMFFYRENLRRMVIPSLLAGLIMFLILLIRDPGFNRRKLWLPDGFFSHLKPIVVRLFTGGAILFLYLKLERPDLLFNFIRAEPKIWLIVMLLYPLVSVYPQEIIYRAYFFHRYQPLFPNPVVMILASGLCFGLVHIFFFNAWALTLSTIGGILFAWTYHRSGSILFSSIEHGLWGDFIFTAGLGMYFYSGAI